MHSVVASHQPSNHYHRHHHHHHHGIFLFDSILVCSEFRAHFHLCFHFYKWNTLFSLNQFRNSNSNLIIFFACVWEKLGFWFLVVNMSLVTKKKKNRTLIKYETNRKSFQCVPKNYLKRMQFTVIVHVPYTNTNKIDFYFWIEISFFVTEKRNNFIFHSLNFIKFLNEHQ